MLDLTGKSVLLTGVTGFLGLNYSVIPFFMNKKQEGVLQITESNMTHFNVPVQEGVDMPFFAEENSWGEEFFIPKASSYRIMELAQTKAHDCGHQFIGVRSRGEKIRIHIDPNFEA